MKFTTSLKLKLIYVFRINDTAHLGCLKIGEATSEDAELFGLKPNSTVLNKAAKARINQYTQTAGISYELLFTELAIYTKDKKIHGFSDNEVHNVLLRSGVKRKVFDTKNKANEWFITDLETVKNAISAVKEGRDSLHTGEISKSQSPIIFRPEQKEAIEKTAKQFKKGNEMLWFAKMRFGKTLSALQVVKDHEFTRTLILTHRPVVDKGWFEDFRKIFYDSPEYEYGSKNQGGHFKTLERDCKKGKSSYIYFASMQDLRGSDSVGGNFIKNEEIFNTEWDFIIIDEAHEGTQTELGKNVLEGIKKSNTKVLHLSGTPFNLIDNFEDNKIFTWDYVMEQKAKADWDKIHFGDPNPYASLPKLNIFTYDLGKLLRSYIDEEIAFNFREFFRVNEQGDFLHKKDVLSFLNLICKSDKDSNYPYSTEAYRDNFRHSLWMVPGVKEARALSAMLQEHPVFSEFKIVNVAGDGDEEEPNEEALKKVEKAITDRPQETYTITLSCGRLTTGVSVKAWTAVFMLSGSHNTSASSYMQTIFRVQTPATINGKVKEECFVFDFAPDRTLKVIAETAKVSAIAGKTSDSDRNIMGEFLNFCPIIAYDGTRMKDYDVNGLLEQLKKVYIERVVNNGFEDGHLYNRDQLMQLSDLEIEEFNGLKKVIGSTKAMPKSNDIEVNKHGFTDEDYERIDQAQKKKKRELTPEEKELLEQYKQQKKMRDTAISILRGISIRMPLLIYGADVKNEDQELTLDNFTYLVDDQSWEEFMPNGVTKLTFQNFKKYYERDVFRAAGKRIRALARAADNLTVEERIERITNIFGTFRNPDKETVLTPWRVVNMQMGDCLGGYSFLDKARDKTITIPHFTSRGTVTKEVFNADSRILEINSKSGLYPLYVSYSIYRNRIKEKFSDSESYILSVEEQRELWDKTVAENVFVLCKTPMAKSITKRTLVGFSEAKVNTHYFEDMVHQITNRPDKFIAKIRKGKSYWKANNNNNMRFNAIVGNPPYQEMAESGNRSKPIYNLFVDISKSLNPNYLTLIIPSRWMSGGLGLTDFRERMLEDRRFAELTDYPDSNQVFPGVEIKGGVCYFLWKSDYYGKCSITTIREKNIQGPVKRKLNKFDILIRDSISVKILEKILIKNEESITSILSVDKEFGWTSNYRKFSIEKRPSYIPLHYIERGRRKVGWIDRDEIKKSKELIDNYKVLVPKAGSDGGKKIPDIVLGKPKLADNPSVCTQSYLFFYLKSKQESINLEKYLRTKFFRFLVSLRKMTQDATRSTYSWVPLLDLTLDSDIDWTNDVVQIEKELYNKYSLNDEEISFIETMIKPMNG